MYKLSEETPHGLYQLTTPKAVLFDWDNTLVDTYHTIWVAMNKTLSHFGFPPLSLEDVYNDPGHSIRDFFPKFFGEQHKEACLIFNEAYKVATKNNLRTFAYVQHLLEMLHEQGIYIAAVSNKEGYHLRSEAKLLKIETFFQKMVGSQDTHADKPSPVPLLDALAPSQIEPGLHVWFVGDSEVDVLCAQNAGCTPVLIHRPEKNYNGAHNVQNCQELKKIILQSLKEDKNIHN